MADEPGPIDALDGSPWGQCLNGVANTIIDLNLDEIGANVWIRDPPTIKGLILPAVVLTPFTPSHTPAAGTMTAGDLTLRVMAGVIRSNAGGVSNSGLATRLEWYHALFAAFCKVPKPFQVTAGGATLLHTNIEPGDPRVVEAWQIGQDAEWLSIACYVRYPSTA